MKKDDKGVVRTEAPKDAAPENVRGRPGRRSAEDRRRAVLELLGGKATVDQVAVRFGVLPQTVNAPQTLLRTVLKDLPLERWYREIRIRRIGEGPSEVQRLIMARDLLGGSFH